MKSKIKQWLFLIAGLLVSLNASAYHFRIDGLAYNINADGKSVSVTYNNTDGYGSGTPHPTYYGNIVIPERVKHLSTTYTVTSIGEDAFYACNGLTSVTIGKSVTSIGGSAFKECTGLTGITIPNSVTEIGGSAFSGCTGLTGITIPNSVTSIGFRAFYECTGLTSITIPNSVTSIGEDVFYGCTGLTSVTIPNSVTLIGDGAFQYCTGLTSVTIPNSVTSIGEDAFYGCTGLTSVTIGNSVTSIGEDAFYGCTGLRFVNMLKPNPPRTCASFGNILTIFVPKGSLQAYKNSTDWNNKNIKEGLGVSIGNSFYELKETTQTAEVLGPTSTTVTSFDIPSLVTYNGQTYSVTSIGDNAFLNCIGLTSITIPNYITSIGNSVFNGCTGLTSITIPNSVTSIGGYAFRYCSSLTSITIPNSVTSIGNEAFKRCTGLTSVTIPNSVTSIGEYAFYGCTGLTSVTIPNSVISIGYKAFYNCTGLMEVICLNPGPPKCDGSPFSDYTNTNLYVQEVSCDLYRANYPWSNFANIEILQTDFLGDDFIFRIDYNNGTAEPIYNINPNIIDLVIPSTVKVRGTNYVVTGIGASAFIGCTELTSVTIPNSVTSIGASAFSACLSLTSIAIPNGVTSIGTSAFSGCAGLTSLTIPSSVTTIGENAFLNCNLRSITIDDLNWWFKTDNNMCLQGPGMIYLNGELIKHLIIPDGISTVRASAFRNCEGITGLTIPNTVTAINDQAFMGCSRLQNVIIGESVLNIGMQVFKGSSNIKEITCFGFSPATIYADTFQNYDATLYVPGGSLNHYKSAEHWLNFNRVTEGVSGVDGIEADGIKVVAKGGAIEVSGVEGERVEVYSLSGQCVYSGMETSISVEKGIYIVRVAGTVHKVII